MSQRAEPAARGVRIGSLVGLVGGVVFVVVNAGALPGAAVWRAGAVGGAVVVVALVLTRPVPAPPAPAPEAVRTYLLCVGAMMIAIPLGSALLSSRDHADLVLPWVVAVVGLHFVPFAGAFGAPVFRVLGAAMVVVAAVGAAATLNGVGRAPEATGVAAGVALLLAAAAPYVVARRSSAPTGP